MIELDHPRLRASSICPLCEGMKDRHLVVCWTCFHEHGVDHCNPDAEAAIDAAEAELERLERAAEDAEESPAGYSARLGVGRG